MGDPSKKTCSFRIEKWLDERADDWLGVHRIYRGKAEFINRAIGRYLDTLEYEENLEERVARRVSRELNEEMVFEDTFFLQDDDSAGYEKILEVYTRTVHHVPDANSARERLLYLAVKAECRIVLAEMEVGNEDFTFEPMVLDALEKQDIVESAAIEGAFEYLSNSVDGEYEVREDGVKEFARAKLVELLASKEYEDKNALTGDLQSAVERKYERGS